MSWIDDGMNQLQIRVNVRTRSGVPGICAINFIPLIFLTLAGHHPLALSRSELASISASTAAVLLVR